MITALEKFARDSTHPSPECSTQWMFARKKIERMLGSDRILIEYGKSRCGEIVPERNQRRPNPVMPVISAFFIGEGNYVEKPKIKMAIPIRDSLLSIFDLSLLLRHGGSKGHFRKEG